MAADRISADGVRATFRAMGCEASILVVGDAECAPAVERVRELERRWSRFLPDSEVSLLNAAPGVARHVSADTVVLVTAMVQAWTATGGAFDPTLLGPLVGLGYAASRDDATIRTSLPAGSCGRGRPDAILVDPGARIVRLPAGTAIDPGGIGKGLAADLVAGELIAAGATGAIVEIGGDLRVAGEPPADGGWTVAIDPLRTGGTTDHVRLRLGGVATSSSRLRTWRHDGIDRHHLLDPSTGRPAAGDVVACTVVAGTAAWAEAFTKLAFAHGARAASERYAELGLAARITTSDGTGHTTPAWTELACRGTSKGVPHVEGVPTLKESAP